MVIWSKLRKKFKQIDSVLKADWRKDVEDGLLLDCLKKLLNQNTESMNMLVNSLKEGLVVKNDPPAVLNAAVTAGKTIKLTKPVKVPSWSQDMTIWYLPELNFSEIL